MGYGDDVRCVNQLALERGAAGERRGNPLRDQALRDLLVLLAPRLGTDLVDLRRELGEGIPRRVHRIGQPLPGGLDEVPPRGHLDEPVHAGQEIVLRHRVDDAVQLLDLLPSGDGSRHVSRDPERPDDIGGMGADLGDHPRGERDALGVHDVVGGHRRDDLPLQRVLAEEVAESVDDRGREVPGQIRFEIVAVRQLALQERPEHRALSVRQQDGQLRARHAGSVRPAFRHLIGRGQGFDGPFQLTLGLELLHQVLVGLDPLGGLLLFLREDLRLEVVVVEHVRDDVGRTRLEHPVPALERELAARDREPQQDLPIDLVVGGVDARGVVDEIGVDAPARPGVLDPPELREPEVPSLADDPRAEIPPIDP